MKFSSLVPLIFGVAICGCGVAAKHAPATTNNGSAASTLAASTTSAAPANAVQAPTLHAGDTWIDELSGGTRGKMVVVSVSDDSATIDEWGSKDMTDARANLRNGYLWFSSKGQSQVLPTMFKPLLDIFDFPLYPGKTWSRRYRWRESGGDVWGDATASGKVVGWESVTVPAGTFKALRVDVTNRGVDTDYDVTYWYAPSVARFVKAQTNTGFQAALIAYHPAGAQHAAQ